MLKKESIDFFDEHQHDRRDYEEALTMLRDWYLSTEQRARLLAEWQTVRIFE